MHDLVVASNRGPFGLRRSEKGTVEAVHSAGGLAPSLLRALRGRDALWLAAALNDVERDVASGQAEAPPAEVSSRFLEIPEHIQRAAYSVVANGLLWFCYHGLFDRARRPLFNRHLHEAWDSYREYNTAFAQAIAEMAAPGGTVVVNDYHLSLVGEVLRRERGDLKTVHFSHTPFCAPTELSVLPSSVARELLSGLSSFGACGFHTERWSSAFRACAESFDVEVPFLFSAPLGADRAALEAVIERPGARAASERLSDWLDGRRLIFRNDRVELSKNVLRGFFAFEELLERRHDLRERVVFLARAYSSRDDLAEYRAYRNEVEHVVAVVNERFATPRWTPIVLETTDDIEASLAAATRYDVLLVNPIRDGMNLVAKEGSVLNKSDGVLLLSTEAGAYDELGADAIGLEPFDISGTAAALESGLEMGPKERATRARALAEKSARNSPGIWLDELLGAARRPAS